MCQQMCVCCAVAFDNVTSCIGATLPVVGEHISFGKIAESISKVTGKTVKYTEVPRDVAASFPFPAAAELANMFQFYNDFSMFADNRPVDKTVVRGSTFQKWAEENADGLKAVLAKAG